MRGSMLGWVGGVVTVSLAPFHARRGVVSTDAAAAVLLVFDGIDMRALHNGQQGECTIQPVIQLMKNNEGVCITLLLLQNLL